MENLTEEEELKRVIDRWLLGIQRRFKDKFGLELITRYKMEPPPAPKLIPLEVILHACEAVLNTLDTQMFQEGLRTVFYDPNVLLCRQIFFKISIESGHAQTRAAKFVKQSGPVAAYGRGRINKLISEKDEKTIRVYQDIKRKIDDAILRGLEVP